MHVNIIVHRRPLNMSLIFIVAAPPALFLPALYAILIKTIRHSGTLILLRGRRCMYMYGVGPTSLKKHRSAFSLPPGGAASFANGPTGAASPSTLV